MRYLTFRLRYDPRELVIRSGLLFRNERHVPFAKIQNLDAVQNAFHRLLGVVEIRVQTGGGKDDEARLSVLPSAAFEEMRQRVFEGRAGAPAPSAADETVQPRPGAAPATLLHLPVPELLLCGFLENKGMILIGAAYGIAWESGLLGGFWNRLFGEETYGRGLLRDLITGFFEGKELPLTAVGVALGGLAVLLLLIRAHLDGLGFRPAVRLPALACPRGPADRVRPADACRRHHPAPPRADHHDQPGTAAPVAGARVGSRRDRRRRSLRDGRPSRSRVAGAADSPGRRCRGFSTRSCPGSICRRWRGSPCTRARSGAP